MYSGKSGGGMEHLFQKLQTTHIFKKIDIAPQGPTSLLHCVSLSLSLSAMYFFPGNVSILSGNTIPPARLHSASSLSGHLTT